VADPWADRAFLRGTQYKTDANLAARQSIYAYQQPRIDLAARVVDLAAPEPSGTVADIGCGNGRYLAELASRGFPGRLLGLDLSSGMLAAAHRRLTEADQAGNASTADAPAGTAGTADAPAGTAGTAGVPAGTAGSADTSAGTQAPAVALVVADATALPLRDGTVSLALAMHMLYHVPDPADALRELRRVTRAGGRVVIGLNGTGHLHQLRAAVAAARGDDPATLTERIGLDDGASLARAFFPRVTRHDFVAELHVPAPGPIADYVRSSSGTHYSADPERIAATVLAAIPRNAAGHYLISTHAGCLICEVA
jgi:SAM-dependent methyltransferase